MLQFKAAFGIWTINMTPSLQLLGVLVIFTSIACTRSTTPAPPPAEECFQHNILIGEPFFPPGFKLENGSFPDLGGPPYPMLRILDRIRSEQDCQAECAKLDACLYFTYLPDSKQCLLKRPRPYSRLGFKSGTRYGLDCRLSNVELAGADIRYEHNVNSIQDCQGICEAEKNCLYFTYSPGFNVCSLRYPPTSQLMGAYSGHKFCKQPPSA